MATDCPEDVIRRSRPSFLHSVALTFVRFLPLTECPNYEVKCPSTFSGLFCNWKIFSTPQWTHSSWWLNHMPQGANHVSYSKLQAKILCDWWPPRNAFGVGSHLALAINELGLGGLFRMSTSGSMPNFYTRNIYVVVRCWNLDCNPCSRGCFQHSHAILTWHAKSSHEHSPYPGLWFQEQDNLHQLTSEQIELIRNLQLLTFGRTPELLTGRKLNYDRSIGFCTVAVPSVDSPEQWRWNYTSALYLCKSCFIFGAIVVKEIM